MTADVASVFTMRRAVHAAVIQPGAAMGFG